MNKQDFVAPEAGRVVQTATGYLAFVPAPLPPTINYTTSLVMALSQADAALSELSGLGRLLPNPHLLISPYVQREAVLSSRIEGTQASLSDLLLEDAGAGGPLSPRLTSDVREIRNYVTALNYGVEHLNDLPLSLRLVRDIHEKLMSGVRGDQATPGQFRTSQNWIGPSGCTPSTAPYVPPPPDKMHDCLHEWEMFLHKRDVLPDLIQCALIHVQFESIHPFLDGNGRIGRLLITLFLMERQRLTQPLLYLSTYIEAHRNTYYELLQKVRTHGDWEAWLLFFLTGVFKTAQEATQQANELLTLRETFRARVSYSVKAMALLDWLFVNPYTTAARAAELLGGTTPNTARQAIAVLEREGMLHEITGGSYGRVYLARPILAAIEGTNSEKLP